MGDLANEGQGVTAATKIPRGARTGDLNLGEMRRMEESGIGKLQVGVWANGELQPIDLTHCRTFWPRLIRIAPDCHSQNVRLSRSYNSVFVQATKDVQPGCELLIWFDEDILVEEMQIPPYLTPSNIRGGNSYICHLCGRSFEAPNPLKVHISLKCGNLPLSELWERLVKARKALPILVEEAHSPSQTRFWSPLMSSSSSSGSFKAPTPPSPLVPILINRESQMRPRQVLFKGLSVPSSVSQPFHHPGILPPTTTSTTSIIFSNHNGRQNRKDNFNANGLQLRDVTPQSTAGSNERTKQTNGHNRSRNNNRNPSVEKAIAISVSDPEAQLESIVSNMGKARNGHLCLYCGKLYSRKYGLKIHIRTHTGYKPLKCKICHRPFGDPSNLNKHIRLHSDGNTPYRCEICGKVLVRKRDLERHIRSRHTSTATNGSQLQLPLQRALDPRRTPTPNYATEETDNSLS